MRFTQPGELEDPRSLSVLLGPIRAISTEVMKTVGFTTATHRRLIVTLDDGTERRFVVKTTSPRSDWTALRTNDRGGREGLLLAEPRLGDVWSAFDSPYVAFVATDDDVALLMHDVSANLLPDVREPLHDADERAVLTSLAKLHAVYWSRSDLPDWLTTPAGYASFIGPACLDSEQFDVIPPALRRRIHDGWIAAFRMLPERVVGGLRAPADEIAARWMAGPTTMIHGDSKVANFAVFPHGRVSAFDWALAGAAPAAMELGWYVAVNASRLVGSKDDTLTRYRGLLAAARGTDLSAEQWRDFNATVVVGGSLMGLWAKALAAETKTESALREWDWWADQLAQLF